MVSAGEPCNEVSDVAAAMQRAAQRVGPRLHLAATFSAQHEDATRCYYLCKEYDMRNKVTNR